MRLDGGIEEEGLAPDEEVGLGGLVVVVIVVGEGSIGRCKVAIHGGDDSGRKKRGYGRRTSGTGLDQTDGGTFTWRASRAACQWHKPSACLKAHLHANY